MRQLQLPSLVFVFSFDYFLFALPVRIVFLPVFQALPTKAPVPMREQGIGLYMGPMPFPGSPGRCHSFSRMQA
jgi:hypothetical protein